MKKQTMLNFACLVFSFWWIPSQTLAQGYIVPNGIITNWFPGEIDVWNSSGVAVGSTNMTQVTGFSLSPFSKQPPTAYTNVFSFSEPVTIGVRVFLVASNEAISLQPILSQTWVELIEGTTYVFQAGVPFYVALYTGSNFAPPYPPFPPYQYLDPVFGWARLVNNNGFIQVLDGAVEYGGAGIIAGTQTVIQPVPEPTNLSLLGLGGLGLWLVKKRQNRRI